MPVATLLPPPGLGAGQEERAGQGEGAPSPQGAAPSSRPALPGELFWLLLFI